MDELKIKSTFMKGILNKVLSKMIQKKLGYKVDIRIEDLDIKIINEKACLHANIEAEIDKAEFAQIMKTII